MGGVRCGDDDRVGPGGDQCVKIGEQRAVIGLCDGGTVRPRLDDAEQGRLVTGFRRLDMGFANDAGADDRDAGWIHVHCPPNDFASAYAS